MGKKNEEKARYGILYKSILSLITRNKEEDEDMQMCADKNEGDVTIQATEYGCILIFEKPNGITVTGRFFNGSSELMKQNTFIEIIGASGLDIQAFFDKWSIAVGINKDSRWLNETAANVQEIWFKQTCLKVEDEDSI